MAQTICDAVTALLCCEDQLYLAQRQPWLQSFPGYHAFPGGKVDDGDAEGTALPPLLAAHDARLMRALARELDEELGYDLIAAARDGEVLAVHSAARALTPPGGGGRRFDTHFYLIRLRSRPAFALHPEEHSSSEWATRAEWLRRHDAGELLVAPPTLRVLTALEDPLNPRFIDLNADHLLGDPPLIESLRGVRMILVRSHTLPPATHTNCFLLGDDGAHRVLVDPSPCSTAEMERLLERVAELGFSEVFLTHHHPDHRQRADEIARRAGVPIGMSADTAQRLQRLQPGIFEGLQLKLYGDGDVLTQWLGQPVRTLAVPGHDEGQLALMPDNRAWCIVGDLIQGVGTVVVGGPEGDMAKYYASLERIIALAPRVIYPSHGFALGGTFYLQKTLQHRRQREAQIKQLFDEGVAPEDMTARIYADVDPRLLPLARLNIDSHLKKMRAEGLLVRA